jgi:excinuclease UvrABC helicase subunit UvrB
MFGRRRRNLNFDELMAHYEKMMESFPKKNWSEESYESPDGSYKVKSYLKVFDLSELSEMFDTKISKEEELKMKLNKSIEDENFEEAVKLRDKLKNLEVNQKEIEKLELDLKESIKTQNFEKAIELRDELKKIKF